MHWISRYHRFCAGVKTDEVRGKSDPARITAFTAALAHRYHDWQVQQAKEAVGLLLYYNHTHVKGSPGESPRLERPAAETEHTALSAGHRARFPQEKDGGTWAAAEAEIRTILRLRNRSYRTEKAYLGWIRRFGPFLARENPRQVVEAVT